MKFTSLRYFLVVAHELNITRAAEKLFITQQSLSEQISRLEAEYRVCLFERTPRLRLTDAGERMVEYAEKILRLERNYRSEVANLAKEQKLSVGIRNPVSNMILPNLLPGFIASHPHVRLHLTVSTSRTIAQMLKMRQLDFCIGSPRLLIDPAFETLYLPDDHYVIIIPQNILNSIFHMTKEDVMNGKTPDYHLLESAPLLLMKESSSITRMAVNQFLDQLNIINHNVLMECHNIDTALMAASIGLGVFFAQNRVFQSYVRRNVMQQELFGFPLETPTIDLRTVISYHRGNILSQDALDFIREVTRIYSAEDQQGIPC